MNQKKPFPCIEHLLCAPAYTHVSLIMAEDLQGKPSLLENRGGIQTQACELSEPMVLTTAPMCLWKA